MNPGTTTTAVSERPRHKIVRDQDRNLTTKTYVKEVDQPTGTRLAHFAETPSWNELIYKFPMKSVNETMGQETLITFVSHGN